MCIRDRRKTEEDKPLPFADNSFDLVLNRHDSYDVNEVRRVLKPGGYFITQDVYKRQGYTWFYSRSRQTLWNKGATSGHTQKVISMYADCDDDTLLVKVVQTGAACHTGSHSCFYKEIARN